MTKPFALAASAPELTLRAVACAMGMMTTMIITRTGRRRASA